MEESQNNTPTKVEPQAKDTIPKRDRVVILGRRSAGKTVYLSLLYEMLWKTDGDLSMKAVSGVNHLEYVKNASDLCKGIWPAATQNMSQAFIEVTYKGRQKLAVLLDYPGEYFSNTFVKDIESEENSILLDHIDHAEAVVILVDPMHVVSDDVSIRVDNDYGIVQAMNRVLNWGDGETIPVVLVLTKADENDAIINEHGGTAEFIKKFFPQLMKNVKNLRACRVSAVQVEKGKDGRNYPKKGFKPINLEKPILYCFDVVDDKENKWAEEERQEQLLRHVKAVEKQGKYKNAIMYLVILLIFLVLIVTIVYILPVSTWNNIIEKLS